MSEEGGLDQLASRLERGKRTPPTPRRPRPGEPPVPEEGPRTSLERERGQEEPADDLEPFVSTRDPLIDKVGVSTAAPMQEHGISHVAASALTEPTALPVSPEQVGDSVPWNALARQLTGAPTSALTVRIRTPLADMLERVVYQARERGERISRVELTELALLELSKLDTTEVVRKVRSLRQVAERRGG